MTTEAVRPRYVLKGCQRCNGDIVPDEYGDRRCLQIAAEDDELLALEMQARKHGRRLHGASHGGMRL